MGRALLGLMRSGTRAEQLTWGRVAAARSCARELGVAASPDNETAIAGAGIVVLAVKPQEAQAVLKPLAPTLAAARPLIISVLAGPRDMDLEAWCGSEVPVVRAMPNRPALLGAGISGMYAPLKVNAAQRSSAEHILKAVGEVVWVATEDTLDVVTALSGSGPAYFFLLAECMAEAGQQLGLEHAVAARGGDALRPGLMARVRPNRPAARRRHLAAAPRGGAARFENGGLKKPWPRRWRPSGRAGASWPPPPRS
jgi:pyrroline-5-carboxylate reductase